MSSRHNFICCCVTNQSGNYSNDQETFSTVLSHIYSVLKRSGTRKSTGGLLRIASSHISCLLKWWRTCTRAYGLLRMTSLYISFLLKWSGTYFIKPNKISWNIILNNNAIILFYTIRPRQGSIFMILYFHNPHFLVHRHDLSCLLCVHLLKQVQDNHQGYTPKDNLS